MVNYCSFIFSQGWQSKFELIVGKARSNSVKIRKRAADAEAGISPKSP
jgi:hypothetical protein